MRNNMKVVGIIGLKMSEFRDWCNARKLKRKTDKVYYDIYANIEYVYIGDFRDIDGRQFDEVIDLDRFRQDLNGDERG